MAPSGDVSSVGDMGSTGVRRDRALDTYTLGERIQERKSGTRDPRDGGSGRGRQVPRGVVGGFWHTKDAIKRLVLWAFWGLQIAKNTEQWRDEATCYFFLFGLACVFTFIQKGKDKDVKQHSHRKQEIKQTQ